MRNVHVAAAVAAALGISGAAFAANPPTPSGAMSAAHNVYMAGSSAAVNGVLAYLEATVCGGTGWSLFTSPTTTTGLPDFRAVSCSPASGQPFSGSTLTVWYRPEGGSVVGVFPVVNNTSIKQLNMNTASCTSTGSNATSATYNCTSVTGVTPANGTDDSFGPTGVQSHTVDVGVSDLEPGVFANLSGATPAWAGGGNNDPIPTYSTTFTGADQSVDTVQGMTHFIPFQQVFGFIVSTSLAITDLPKEQIAAIFDGSVVDWANVSTGTSSGHVTATSTPIVVCNREVGSGTRSQADVFLNGDGCNGVGTVSILSEVQGQVVKTPGGTITEPNDNFQTAAELDCVNGHQNSIGYVSIDKFPGAGANSNKITVSGAAATQINAATGVYSDVFEASINLNASASSDGNTFYTALSNTLSAVNNVPKSGQILAIPGAVGTTNAAKIPLQQGSPSTEFTSLFQRSPSAGNSCTPLTDQL